MVKIFFFSGGIKVNFRVPLIEFLAADSNSSNLYAKVHENDFYGWLRCKEIMSKTPKEDGFVFFGYLIKKTKSQNLGGFYFNKDLKNGSFIVAKESDDYNNHNVCFYFNDYWETTKMHRRNWHNCIKDPENRFGLRRKILS